jgi:inhibitor of cysteine peptidase
MVWYDLMVDESGEALPAVGIEGIENGDWIMVTGELQPGGATPAEFWASGIDEAVAADAAADGGEVTLAVGDLLVVTLESNPTTGYAWSLAGAGESGVIAVAGNEFIAPESTEPLVGQGGVEVWTFQALAAGEVTIAMEYVRPWEQGVDPVDTFDITVVVE